MRYPIITRIQRFDSHLEVEILKFLDPSWLPINSESNYLNLIIFQIFRTFLRNLHIRRIGIFRDYIWITYAPKSQIFFGFTDNLGRRPKIWTTDEQIPRAKKEFNEKFYPEILIPCFSIFFCKYSMWTHFWFWKFFMEIFQ